MPRLLALLAVLSLVALAAPASAAPTPDVAWAKVKDKAPGPAKTSLKDALAAPATTLAPGGELVHLKVEAGDALIDEIERAGG